VIRRERPRRDQFLALLAQQPAATVVMEACGSAHYWGRQIQALGHRVVLLPPHHVRPYIQRNKTDRSDAKGILEASRNEDIRPVPVKTVAQQVLTSLHRLRSGWMLERTARLNALRGLLRELGVFIPVGARQVVPAVWALIEDADSELPDALKPIFAEACREIRDIEARVKMIERQLEAMAEQIPAVEHLRTIPGVGLLTSTALVAFLGDIGRFPSGRHLASYLGLTPREYSSGLKRNLGRISKRGDGYLRLGGHLKTGRSWTGQNRPFPGSGRDQWKVYRVASSWRKSA
jgi:transposase